MHIMKGEPSKTVYRAEWKPGRCLVYISVKLVLKAKGRDYLLRVGRILQPLRVTTLSSSWSS